MYTIAYQTDAAAELRAARAFDRVKILKDISEHLTTAPATMGGRKKKIDLGDGDFVLQLKVGAFRVFYDVDEASKLVTVRHVRHKGRKTTGEIL